MFATTTGRDLLRKGTQRLRVASTITEREGPTEDAAEAVNDSVYILRSAMNWLEDTDEFELAHQTLDQAGTLRRTHFRKQCRLDFDEHGYAITCPVWLAHSRVGLSPGYIVRAAECSICHLDPEDCPHIVGHSYDREVCHRIITRLDLLEVSLVGRPAQPDARIQRVGVSDADLRAQLGSRFRHGIPITCDRCLSQCDGLSRPFEGSSHGVLAVAHDSSQEVTKSRRRSIATRAHED